MIGSLRILTLLTSGLWLGTATFVTIALKPAMRSQAMQELLGANNFGYYSFALEHVLLQRYGIVLVFCACVACVNLFAVWLYFGRLPQRPWLDLLAVLVALSLVQAFWIQPKLERAHRTRYTLNQELAIRQAASRSFRTWQRASNVVNWLLVTGLAVHLWRAANPTDPARFVSAVKFRG